MRSSGRSTLLTTTMGRRPSASALPVTNLVCGIAPSDASTSRMTPSTIDRMRSTSPPKSACPGVSTILMRVSCHSTEVHFARIVIPRSFSRSFESIARSSTRWLSRKVPDWRKSWSTSVVLPWSTCAIIAILRRDMNIAFWEWGRPQSPDFAAPITQSCVAAQHRCCCKARYLWSKQPAMLARIFADRFVLLLLATIILASVLPVRGQAAETAALISMAAIFLLFFLNGVRLPRDEVLHGVRNWRLQGAIFLFVFGIMPMVGLALSHLFDNILPATLALGLLFAGILPSTIQSAAAYSALAKGNVAASVVAAALVNLVRRHSVALVVRCVGACRRGKCVG